MISLDMSFGDKVVIAVNVDQERLYPKVTELKDERIRLIEKQDLPTVFCIWKGFVSRSACGWIFELGKDLICYDNLLL